jgi:hypothetical protein
MEQCSHHIIEDYIDIDPDRSKQVFYCEFCYKCSTYKEYIKQFIQDISGSVIQLNHQDY